MRRAVFALIILIALAPGAAHAFVPFGGLVTKTSVRLVECPFSQGPITIIPAGPFPPFPYVITPTTRRYSDGHVRVGDYILGFYLPILVPICYARTMPPFPVLVFPVILFGAS